MNQRTILIQAMRDRGERLTTLDALQRYNIMAVSQRMTELQRDGYPVVSEMVKVPSGKRVARYWWAGQSEMAL